MSRKCQVTGKSGLVGHYVSHSQRKTLRRQQPNLHTKRFFIQEENRWVKIKVSAAGMRTINKKGIASIAAELGLQSFFYLISIHAKQLEFHSNQPEKILVD